MLHSRTEVQHDLGASRRGHQLSAEEGGAVRQGVQEMISEDLRPGPEAQVEVSQWKGREGLWKESFRQKQQLCEDPEALDLQILLWCPFSPIYVIGDREK